MSEKSNADKAAAPKPETKPVLVEKELSPTQLDRVAGGKPSMSDIHVTKPADKTTP